MGLLLSALGVFLGSGLLALGAWRLPRVAAGIGVGGAVAGALLALFPVISVLRGAAAMEYRHAWAVPGASFHLQLDALSAWFAVPVLVLGALAAVYGAGYMAAYGRRRSLGPPWFAYNGLLASLLLVVLARNAVLFLVAWEAMSLAAWMLVTFEHEQPEVRRAGWVYLIAAHVGTASLVALFLLFGRAPGGMDFGAFVRPEAGGVLQAVLFLLALAGFGVKAGFVPLHVWLPEAHAAAPSHVSAMMSGVMIKMGVYGLLRTVVLLGGPAPGWGTVLIVLGLAGALGGIALALFQRDVKRALAYSSVENMGLIVLGLGLGFWGATSGRPGVAALGFAGGLLHVWNHAAMKGLMFLGAGSILHGAGTRDMERLGGLMKPMPATGALMTVGAVAISALPPLNGFVSEWLLYVGLVRGGMVSGGVGTIAPLIAVGALAIVGGLAGACFVRLIGIVFLGTPRHDAARHAHESGASMLAPMAILAFACAALACLPGPVASAAAPVAQAVAGRTPLPGVAEAGVPLATLGAANAVLWAALAVAAGGLALLLRGKPRAASATWGCGYLAPTPRMQYTSRSFSEFLAARLVPRFLRSPAAVHPPAGLFPTHGDFHAEDVDPVTRGAYEPFLARWATRFTRIRILQTGELHLYILYVLAVVVLGLGWATWRTWSGGR